MQGSVKVYTDGGARGNPGPSASGFVVIIDGTITETGSSYVGVGTNNQAEYKGVILAFEWLISNLNVLEGKKDINFFLDSELVTRQLSGQYRVKNNGLLSLCLKVKKLEKELNIPVKYTAVKREENKLADKLVNEALDKNILAGV